MQPAGLGLVEIGGRPAIGPVDRFGAPVHVPGTVRHPGLARRFRLKMMAEGLMSDVGPRIDRYGQERAHFLYRVAMCQRGTDGGDVVIFRSPDRQHARFHGLQTCGSVWHCPICAPKVGRERRDQMNLALSRHLAGWNGHQAGRVYFLTFTLQHDAERFGAGNLHAELRALAAALSSLKGRRAYRELMAAAGVLGAVRGLETTFGEINGWHCHTHELAFAAHGAYKLLARKLRGLWVRELLRRDLGGLKPGDLGAERRRKLRALLEHAVTVQDGSYAADYVSKFGREPESDRGAWGIASEMTRSHLKGGQAYDAGPPQRCGDQGKHATPWGLLNDYLDGDRRSGDLFREYAIAMHGRRQLYWSPGLKKHFALFDRADQVIAEAPDARCSDQVVTLSPQLWRLVLQHDARVDVLVAAAELGADGVAALLDRLRGEPTTDPGYFEQGGRYDSRFMLPWRPGWPTE